ncbi:MAG: EAL domain-containing protein [Labilithrix sp.]|nr:EAL domain-containing protein [Labilithrix sp.]MCW5812000.1 EAL domain-containing protein [Labilithrix sp.]
MQLAVSSLMPPSRRTRDVLEARIRGVLAAGPHENPHLQMVFQPVVDLRTGRIAGAEALARFKSPPGETYRTPDLWFDDARRCGLATELELLAIASALSRLDEMPHGTYLALNASPSTLVTTELRELISAVPGERIVLELTEHARVDDYDTLHAAIGWLRARGTRLAVDDAGAGFASFQHILRLQPDIIKLDRSLTSGVDANPVRFALASALVTFAASLGAKICAEGIETSAEMIALQQLGIAKGQGYFLGKPGPLPLPAPPPGIWYGASTSGFATKAKSSVIRDSKRLAALRATGLLDSDAEDAFDRFTRLAARLLRAPVALLSLVDEHRQFFKSAFGGIDVRETPIAYSICAHAVAGKEPIVIEDARTHPLVRDNPAVHAFDIGAYAGVPIVTADEHALGALCVVDTAPHAWTEHDVATLRDLGRLVSAQMDLRKAARELSARAAMSDALLAHTESVFVVFDVDGKIIRASAAACRRLGRKEAELRGERSACIVHADDMPRMKSAREHLLRGAADHVELPHVRILGADGYAAMCVDAALARDPSGAARFFVVTLQLS